MRSLKKRLIEWYVVAPGERMVEWIPEHIRPGDWEHGEPAWSSFLLQFLAQAKLLVLLLPFGPFFGESLLFLLKGFHLRLELLSS